MDSEIFYKCGNGMRCVLRCGEVVELVLRRLGKLIRYIIVLQRAIDDGSGTDEYFMIKASKWEGTSPSGGLRIRPARYALP